MKAGDSDSQKPVKDDAYGAIWDPGTPTPEEGQKLLVDTTVAAGQRGTLDEDRWYYAICTGCNDAHLKLGEEAITNAGMDPELNMPVIQNARNPFYSGKYSHVAVKSRATLAAAAHYVYIIRLEGDDAR